MDETVPVPLNVIAAKYETRCQLRTQGVGVIEQILEANPRRWYVEFLWDASFADTMIGPQNSQAILTATFTPPSMPLVYKFRDCPSFVTGEWYALAPPGRLMYIYECLYTG